MGIKTLYVTEVKIRTRQGFKSGNKREIRVMAPLFFDFFVLLSNLRFKSQSLWLVISEISQMLSFSVHFKVHKC